MLAGIIILSCSWDPIFYNISMEQAPRNPTITGSPQNMIITRDRLYSWTLRGSNLWHFSYSPIADGDDAVSGWRWHDVIGPGPIGGLAAVEFQDAEGNWDYHLYAVVYPGNNPARSEIHRYAGNGNWDLVFPLSPFSIGQLHSAGGEIFARAQRTGNLEEYAILRFVPDPETGALTMSELKTGDFSINLSGAVYRAGQIYLATARGGVFRLAPGIENAPAAFMPPSTFDITGIIVTGDDIVVVGNASNAGVIHVLGSTPSTEWPEPLPSPRGVFFNGGMSVWREFSLGSTSISPNSINSRTNGAVNGNGYPPYNGNDEPPPNNGNDDLPANGNNGNGDVTNGNWIPRLLLVGVRTNSHNVNGYREIVLLPDGSGNVDTFHPPPLLNLPGNLDFSSVTSNSIYRASIGTRSVRFIQQVPNLGGTFYPNPTAMTGEGSEFYGWQPPIFASTSRDGLWVYDFRGDRWNADNNRIDWLAPINPR